MISFYRVMFSGMVSVSNEREFTQNGLLPRSNYIFTVEAVNFNSISLVAHIGPPGTVMVETSIPERMLTMPLCVPCHIIMYVCITIIM